MDSSKAIEQFKCPICLEIPPGNVLQCQSGHTICSHCLGTLKQCPVCRVPYGPEKIRNRQIEFVLDSMTFPCPNEDAGCDQLLRRNAILKHYNNCKFTVKSSQICKMIGFKCPFEVISGEVSSFEKHLQTTHSAFVHHGSQLQLQQIQQPSSSNVSKRLSDIVWNPIIIHSEKKKFLILSLFNGTLESFSWICLNLGEDVEPKFHADFSISGRDHTDDLQWRQYFVKYSEAEMILSAKPFQVPLSLLQEKFMQDGVLEIKLSIGSDSLGKFSVEGNASTSTLITVGSPVEFDVVLGADSRDEDHEFGTVFSKHSCDICSKLPIKGVIFHCLQCHEFDLCKDCFSPNIHGIHVFAMIRSMEQLSMLRRQIESGRPRKPILPPVPLDVNLHDWIKTKNEAIFANVCCNGCLCKPIFGKRFKCLQCLDYDLCETCINAGVHSSHVFGVITNFHQAKFIDEPARRKAPIIRG